MSMMTANKKSNNADDELNENAEPKENDDT